MSPRGLWDRLRQALGYYPSTADEWAVRVQCPDVTRQEFVALDEWLKADPRNAQDYASVNKIAHLGLKLRDHPEARARLLDYPLPAPTPAHGEQEPFWSLHGVTPPRRWSLPLGVASLCAVLLLSIVVVPQMSLFSPRYASGRGEQRQVTLADGSRMLVNTDSEVRVDFDAQQRVLDLVRGEAYFEVAKDPARPFVVRAGKAIVRAIGTKFSVRREADETQVVVTEGRVQVLHATVATSSPAGTESIDLTPGDQARIASAEPTVKVASVDVTQVTAWTVGNVAFDEATLAEVIRDVNRYTAKEFVLDDPALTDIRLTGRFRIGDAESVKSALRYRFGIVAVEDERFIHLKRQ